LIIDDCQSQAHGLTTAAVENRTKLRAKAMLSFFSEIGMLMIEMENGIDLENFGAKILMR
jgi:hypothetical protein